MSKKASVNYCHETVKEALVMEATTNEMAKVGGKGNTLIGYLTEKGVVVETEEEGKYQVNVVKLTGKKLQLGNGSNGKDVYMLEEVGVGTAEIGRYASIEKIKIAETESTKKEYNIKYYGKTEEENVDLGKLTDGGEVSNLSEQEKLIKEIEDMYYIDAWWNAEENKFDYFYLYLLPEVKNKVEEYVINEKIGKMTDEEIVLKQERIWGNTEATTFEKMMEEYVSSGKIKEKCSTAREYMESEYWYDREITDEEYAEEILDVKNEIVEELLNEIKDIEKNKRDIMIYQPDNSSWYYISDFAYSIEEPGKYKYTVKVANREIFNLTITIDQYEVIGWYNRDIDENVVSVYDFVNNKTLKIDSASYEYKGYKRTITAEQIVNEENVSYLKGTIGNNDGTYKYNIIGEGKQTERYYYIEFAI